MCIHAPSIAIAAENRMGGRGAWRPLNKRERPTLHTDYGETTLELVRQQAVQAVRQLSRCITCITPHGDLSIKRRKLHNLKPDVIPQCML